MQTKFSFSMARLRALKPPEKGRLTVRDTGVPGLAIRVTTNGTMTAVIDTKHGGRHVRLRVGNWPGDFGTVVELRKAARKVVADLDQAVKRQQQARREPTLADLFDHWVVHAQLRKKTWKEDVRQFEAYLKRHAGRKLSTITKADVSRWHSRWGERHGPYQANRTRALLSAMFNVADDLGHEGLNPCVGVRKLPEAERERFLQPAEMRSFFAAVKAEPPIWCDFWLVALFSGARWGNVAAMAWKDLDLDAGLWHLPGKKTKAGLPIVVVLAPPAVEVLRARSQERNGNEWVFPANRGATGHVAAPYPSWRRVLERSGIEDLRPHDLRRSLGSWQATAGVSLQIIGASLGHSDVKSTSIYSRLQVEPVRQSVNAAVDAMVQAGGVAITDERKG